MMLTTYESQDIKLKNRVILCPKLNDDVNILPNFDGHLTQRGNGSMTMTNLP